MKLEEAIRVKENYRWLLLGEYYQEFLEADNLSLEALKRFRLQRLTPHSVGFYLLPGETND